MTKIKIIKKGSDYKVIYKPPFILSEDISPLICHRLDYETSGLILVAKTKKAQKFYQNQFKKREIKKKYMALVLGQFPEEKNVEGFIARDKNKPFRFESILTDNQGVRDNNQKNSEFQISNSSLDHRTYRIFGKKARWSKTHFKLLAIKPIKIFKEKKYQDFNFVSLVGASPFTGRRHQIRIHLAHLGYPILGDKTYNTKMSRKAAKNLAIPHLQLLAVELKFKDSFFQLINIKLKPADWLKKWF
ncbi:MAG: RNA pseudouridine synthase [Patescibacteria group bacterium]|nr:RNA pseudouridine synthase [Patescibacteria group bacterium]